MFIIDRTHQTDKTQPLREQQRAFTRKRLIEAARQVFAERGYPDATVDEIASEAGASRATFYLHFKSKTELTAALVEDVTPVAVQRYRLLDEVLASGDPSLRDKLRDWLQDWLGIWRQAAQASRGPTLAQPRSKPPKPPITVTPFSRAFKFTLPDAVS